MQRPVGLAIIAFVFFSGGVLGAVASILMLPPRSLGTTSQMEWILSLSVLVACLAQIVLGIGLWRKRNWARRASIFWGIIWVLGGLVAEITFAVYMPSVFEFSRLQASIAIAQGAFEVWAVIYLLTPRVRGLFLSSRTPST